MLAAIALAIAAGNLLVPDERPTTEAPPVTVKGEGSTTVSGGLAPDPVVIETAVRNLRVDTRRHRAEQRRLSLFRKFRPLPSGVTMERLEEIAECESGGDPRAVSSSGLYHGKYQFHPGTWRSVGGRGLPSQAPEVEQDYRAGLLLERSGPGQWPVCGA